MTRNGEPIETVTVREVIQTGIEFDALLPGLVPLYEEREAATYGHYTWREWRTELEPEERAAAVAQYRLHHLVTLHQNDAMNAAMERRSRQQA